MGPTSNSRDIWSHGSGTQLRDLISSSLATLLLLPKSTKPVYFSSPWISDFVLLNNEFRQFSSLLPQLESHSGIRFGDYLAHLANLMPIRIMAVNNETSRNFISSPQIRQAIDISVKYAPEEHHEKGILTPWFYIQGSMNITYNGVYVKGEKITYQVANGSDGRERIARAYLEFERYWESL
jgi:hypothetical protein